MSTSMFEYYVYPNALNTTEDDKIYAAWIDDKRFFTTEDFDSNSQEQGTYLTWGFQSLRDVLEAYASEYRNIGLELPQLEIVIYHKSGQEIERISVPINKF